MSNKSGSKIVQAFTKSDLDIDSILRNNADSSNPVSNALFLLNEFISGRQSDNEALRVARDVPIQKANADPQLFALFLGNWARATLIKGKISETQAILYQAKSIFDKDLSPEIISYIDTVEANLEGARGNHLKQKEIFTTALNRLPQSSPRLNFIAMTMAKQLARSGQLSEMDEYLKLASRKNSNHAKLDWLDAVRFVNAVETGQTETASSMLIGLENMTLDISFKRDIDKYKQILTFMNAQPANTLNEEELNNSHNTSDWTLVIQCLLSGRPHQALRWARLREKNTNDTVTGNEFISLNLIRAELAEQHADAAKRLINMRHEQGNFLYLDSLFLSRIEILNKNYDAASKLFNQALELSETYNAKGRIDFELRISTEIPRDVILHLAASFNRSNSKHTPSTMKQEIKPTSSEKETVEINHIIGAHTSILEVRERILQFAPLNVPVLITGETGTGKELVARALHYAGPRKDEPFVAINCGAVAEALLESELFGHEKGAFSGATKLRQGLFDEAGKGTILLDEIGDISPRLQIVLLRVLETMEIRPVGSSKSHKLSCRILTSTNADLDKLEQKKLFRSDLMYRLRRLEIHLPPLRERKDDILVLASHFLNIDRSEGITASTSSLLNNILIDYKWPGNVRELRNTIEKMRLMNSDKLQYDAGDIDIRIESTKNTQPHNNDPIKIQKAIPYQPTSISRRSDNTPSNLHPSPTLPEIPTNAPTAFKKGKSRIRRILLIKDLFMKHELLTRNELIQTLKVSPNTITNDLKVLQEENFITKVTPSNSPRSAYFILRS